MPPTRNERLAVGGSGNITADWSPQGFQITDQSVRYVWAEITGNSGARYSWSQVDETDTSFPAFATSDFTLRGTTAAGEWPAYEISGSTTVAAGTKVQLWPSPSGEFWLFTAPPPASGVTSDEFKPNTSEYTLTPSGAYETVTGFTITLPSAGTYLVWAGISGRFRISAFSPAVPASAAIPFVDVYDTTAGNTVLQGSMPGLQVVNRTEYTHTTITGLYAPTSSAVLVVRCWLDSTTTWTDGAIRLSAGTPFYDPRIGYLKLA